MTKQRAKRVIRDTLKKNRLFFILLFLLPLCNLIVFLLYGVLFEAFLYSAVLGVGLGIVLFVPELLISLKNADRREQLLRSLDTEPCALPEPEDLAGQDWYAAVNALGHRAAELSGQLAENRRNTLDYVSAWVHQIKTPIAVMRLQLGSGAGVEQAPLLAELSRIEQYVEMVLQYARLESESNDLVIREYPLDELIRESIRRYARQFILKKLAIDYPGTGLSVITDKKWFCCILDQLLSNAVKYTAEGKITLRVDAVKRELSVSDTGIGIPECDQPRIFEKGYTGLNGREGQNSSGLGLYLCSRAAGLLHLSLRVESVPGKGSSFYVSLPESPAGPGSCGFFQKTLDRREDL